MSNKLPPGDSHDATPQSGSGMKRRDLLLSGSSLVAASALSAVGLNKFCAGAAASTVTRAGRAAAEHRRHHG